jgi:DNA-binding transcriptional ArsR family regulator
VLETLSALAEPNRLKIVELLRKGPQRGGDIGARLDLAQPQVSKHLKVLRGAGLVTARPLAQQRLYELRTEPLRELDAWLEPYRRFWNARLDALEARLDRMPEPPKARRSRRQKK